MDIHFTMKNQANLQQRMTFYCVPIPGESEWVKQVNKLKYYNNKNLYCKRMNLFLWSRRQFLFELLMFYYLNQGL